MPIAFRAASFSTGTASTSATGTEPAGAASGDVIFGFVLVEAGGGSSLTVPTGWTAVTAATTQTDIHARLYYHVRGGSAPTYQFTWNVNNRYYEMMFLAFTGVDGTTPIDAQGTLLQAVTTTVNPPAVTVATDQAWVITVLAHWAGSSGGWTAPTNYTLRTNNTAGNDGAVATRGPLGTGSEDPGNWDAAGGSDDYISHTIALRPAGGGAVDQTVTAVPADATGTSPAPTATADSSVTTPAADATGVAAAPTASAGAQITTPAADATGTAPAPTTSTAQDASATAPAAGATGQSPAPTASAASTVAAPAADGTGDAPPPTASATTDATVTVPAADATGDFPVDDMPFSVTVDAPAAAVTGDAPAPVVSGTGSASVTAPPADATGDAPAPAGRAGSTVTAPAAGAAGDAPAPGISDGTAPLQLVNLNAARSAAFMTVGATTAALERPAVTAGLERPATRATFERPAVSASFEQAQAEVVV